MASSSPGPGNRDEKDSQSNELDEAVFDFVLRDLEPSFGSVNAKAAASSVIGALLALAVCGQFGVGITGFAEAFHHQLHDQMGPVTCAVLCGSLYAIFPVLLLRFVFCNVLQFRAIITYRLPIVVGWLLGVGAVMAWNGHHNDMALQFGAWMLAAILSFIGFGKLSGGLLGARSRLAEIEKGPSH